MNLNFYLKFSATISLLALAGCQRTIRDERCPRIEYLSFPTGISEAIERLNVEGLSDTGPEEIIALLSRAARGSGEGHRVIRVRGGKAELNHYASSLGEHSESVAVASLSKLYRVLPVSGQMSPEASAVYGGLRFWLVRHKEGQLSVESLGAPHASLVAIEFNGDHPPETLVAKLAVISEFRRLMPALVH